MAEPQCREADGFADRLDFLSHHGPAAHAPLFTSELPCAGFPFSALKAQSQHGSCQTQSSTFSGLDIHLFKHDSIFTFSPHLFFQRPHLQVWFAARIGKDMGFHGMKTKSGASSQVAENKENRQGPEKLSKVNQLNRTLRDKRCG